MQIEQGNSATQYEPYYEGLRSAKVEEVKSVGVNVFDISKAQKGSMNANGDFEWYAFTGTFYEYPFEKNTQYTISAYVMNDTYEAQVALRAIYTDGTIGKNIFQTPTDNEWVYKKWTSEAGKTILRLEGWYHTLGTLFIKNGELMINKGTTALPYTPYTEDTLPIAAEVQALDGYGEGINDTCYNYIDYENRQFVKRVGVVDMGTLDWSYDDPVTKFEAVLDNCRESGNVLCTGYETTFSMGEVYGGAPGMICAGSGYIALCDRTYWSAESFKSAVSGKPLYYELATPEIIDISDLISEDNFIGVEGGGTVTAVNEHSLAVPSEITYMLKEVTV